MSEQYFMAIHPIVFEIFISLDQRERDKDRMGMAVAQRVEQVG